MTNHRIMTRTNPIAFLLSLLVLAAASLPTGADIIYNVESYALDNGYAIAGGTITTNDAMDTIIAWDIEVTGPRGFQFQNTNPGAEVLPDAFNITPTEITVTGPAGNSTGFRAFDNADPDCTNCQQSLIYISSGPSVHYSFRDLDDSDPDFDVWFDYSGTLTVATIPEPTSLALLAIGGVALLRRRVRASRVRETIENTPMNGDL